jgi:hypothetical protein
MLWTTHISAVDLDEPIADGEPLKKLVGEFSHRLALHALNLPHVENLSDQEVVARLRDALSKRGDS